MARPTWASAADGWPYERFSFAASVAGSVTHLDGPHSAPPDPGWHVYDGGSLDLVIAATLPPLAYIAFLRSRRQLR